ncbi:MAG TPA: hypothetical protein VGN34_21930 [Ktedonobacteraceae bacterium]|jgi:hypothetical protein|nr:hypothetical protein [Ktedonobacteraceae bacterium]
MTDFRAIYAEGKPPAIPCPVCGAPPELRSWQRFANEQYQTIISPAHSMAGSKVQPLVCTSCGYVQLFVNAKDFRQ